MQPGGPSSESVTAQAERKTLRCRGEPVQLILGGELLPVGQRHASYNQWVQTWYKPPMSPRSGLHDLVLPFNAELLSCHPCVDISYLKLLRMPQGPSLITPLHSIL